MESYGRYISPYNIGFRKQLRLKPTARISDVETQEPSRRENSIPVFKKQSTEVSAFSKRFYFVFFFFFPLHYQPMLEANIRQLKI